MQLSSRTKGTCFLIFSAFSFAWMNAFVRLAGDLSFIQKSFFRNLIALLVALIMLFKERQPLHCDKKSAGALLLRATMGTVGIFCNFYAVDHLPISDASAEHSSVACSSSNRRSRTSHCFPLVLDCWADSGQDLPIPWYAT